MDQKVRLQKYLSMAGIASRRDAEKMILEGRVKVNNTTVQQMGIKVNPLTDTVSVDDRLATLKKEHYYFILNKPEGYLTTTRDPYQRPTVFDLIPELKKEHIFSVGRLDFDAEGILLITNDGELASRLMHPSFKISKTYLVLTQGVISPDKLEHFRKGMKLENEITAPANAKIIRINRKENKTWLTITVHEGKKRQIKRMCRSIGHPVLYLKRISFAFLKLGNLESGSYRSLSREEIVKLYEIVGLTHTVEQKND